MKLNKWQVLAVMALWFTAFATAGVPAVLHYMGAANPVEPAASEATQTSVLHEGIAAFRAGDYKRAQDLWQVELESLTGQPEAQKQVGQLCYNLGNAAYRDGESMRAIAWYTAARRHLPRDPDLLANLKFVRGELALPPEHSSGLLSTVGASLRSWTPAESRNFALFGVLLLAATLLHEALRGGSRARSLAWLGLGLCALLWLPFLRHSLAGESEPQMVIAARGTNGRSEPRPDSKTLIHLDSTAIADRLDTWQDWTKLRTGTGEEVWVTSKRIMSVDW